MGKPKQVEHRINLGLKRDTSKILLKFKRAVEKIRGPVSDSEAVDEFIRQHDPYRNTEQGRV